MSYETETAHYATESIEVNHLEAMAIQMALMRVKDAEGGMSAPEAAVMRKAEAAFATLFAQLRLR